MKKVQWRINLHGLKNGVELTRRRVRPKPNRASMERKKKE